MITIDSSTTPVVVSMKFGCTNPDERDTYHQLEHCSFRGLWVVAAESGEHETIK